MSFGRKKQTYNYFDEFIKSAELAQKIAKKLREVLDNFDEAKMEERAMELHTIENEADNNLHTLKDYLLKDFLPPIDREDVLSIAHQIDNIIDGIDEIIIDISIFNITSIRPELDEILDLLVGTINKTYALLVEFKNMKDKESIRAKCVEVNNLEEQGDRLYEKAIRGLFKTKENPIEVIKWTNIFEALENSFDSCENVAECIEEVLMKNS